MKSYPTKFKRLQRKIVQWEPRNSCKIQYKPLQFCGLSTPIHTNSLFWVISLNYFAIVLLQILLLVVKTLKFSLSFI